VDLCSEYRWRTSGVRLTRFDSTEKGVFYTPSTVIGICLTLLLVGRIAYRAVTFFGPRAPNQPPSALFQSPVTLLVFGLTAGYYLSYQTGVLLRGRKFQTVGARAT